jgi:hypothetical protein
MMKAARTSETLENFYQTTRRYNPEYSHFHESFVRVSDLQAEIRIRDLPNKKNTIPNLSTAEFGKKKYSTRELLQLMDFEQDLSKCLARSVM